MREFLLNYLVGLVVFLLVPMVVIGTGYVLEKLGGSDDVES